MANSRVKGLVSDLQEFYLLSFRGLVGLGRKPFYLTDTLEQMNYTGSGSLLIIVLVSLFIGMALSLQLSAELSRVGLKMYTGRVVGISVTREIGPVLAALVMLPDLTIIGDAMSLSGGYIISVSINQESGSFYWNSILEILNFENVFSGMVKPFMFGYIIACISCYMGLSTSGGAIGLRRTTTKAVVLSFIMIIVANFALTMETRKTCFVWPCLKSSFT